MKKVVPFVAAIFVYATTYSQVQIQDDLVWVPATLTTTMTSPNFQFCEDSINYTISTTSTGGFQHVSGSGNPNLTTGITIPAFSANAATSMDFTITFSQPVNNVRILFVDLDRDHSPANNNPEETITSIVPTYSSVFSTFGTFFPLPFGSGPYNGVSPQDPSNPNTQNNDASGWVEWGPQSLNAISFTYNRPGASYALIIEAIEFESVESDCSGCGCTESVDITTNTLPTSAGIQNTSVNIDSQGELISKLIIDLPYYHSDVDDNCLMCDVQNNESFGTIVNSTTIAGVSGVFYDPFGLGQDFRKIIYTFNTPVAINETIDLNLSFPGVLDLDCCRNRVDYCLNVKMVKDDCSSCEYDVCNDSPTKSTTTENHKIVRESIDGPVQNEFINNVIDELNLEINPNPTQNQINVRIGDSSFRAGTYYLYSSDGNLVKSENIASNEFEVSLINESQGNYILNVISVENKKSTKSIIKL